MVSRFPNVKIVQFGYDIVNFEMTQSCANRGEELFPDCNGNIGCCNREMYHLQEASDKTSTYYSKHTSIDIRGTLQRASGSVNIFYFIIYYYSFSCFNYFFFFSYCRSLHHIQMIITILLHLLCVIGKFSFFFLSFSFFLKKNNNIIITSIHIISIHPNSPGFDAVFDQVWELYFKNEVAKK